MLEWTPPLNEQLFTLNGLWTYTRLCHINAPPLNRHPQPWTLNIFLNTLFKNFMCIAFQNRTTSSSQNNASSALGYGMWRDGTIAIIDTWDSPCARACAWVFSRCVYVCARFDWTRNGKRKYVVNTLGQKADALQDLFDGMAMRAMEKPKTAISWALPKEAIKDDFLSVPLRLNTCLHSTIWPIPDGVQCM